MENSSRKKARNLYLEHDGKMPLTAISEKLDIPYGTIRYWKHKYNWDKKEKTINIPQESKRYKAMDIYINTNREISLSDISRKLDVPTGTIRSWKHRDKWDEIYLLNKGNTAKREGIKKSINQRVYHDTQTVLANISKEIEQWTKEIVKLKEVGDSNDIDINSFIFKSITDAYNSTEDKDTLKYVLGGLNQALEKTNKFKEVEKRRYLEESKRYSVLERADYKCQACGAKPRKGNNVVLHIDHVVPITLGGSNEVNNLQVLCDKCNISKQNDYTTNHNREWE